ncbi:MAG: sodium:solute symporter family protein, partial [Chitinophagaceae bacterium]
MNNWLVITASIAYLLLLFGVAYFAEYQSKKGRSIVKNAYIYALSLAVYCTAWTFFGSVGKAADSGIEFLFIYLGPTLMAPLFWIILRKIIRISKVQRITSIADFISTRYGKNISLGIIVTILCVIGVIPYIAIQIKAVSSSIHLLTGTTSSPFPYSLFSDSGLYLSIGLAVFVILFGTRNVDATEKHEGLVAAIAFESIIKLMAFIAAGLFVTYGLFNGFADIMQKAASLPKLKELMVIPDGNKYLQLFASLFLSMLVVLLLPRQFQVAVVENTHEQHVKKAMWLFPLYLFIINIFVIPIAFGGAIIFQGKAINADTYVLSLPINAGANWLSLLVYIGGFSAASSMIIVETIALSTMMSNNIVMPLLLSANVFTEKINRNISRFIINSRRFSIIGILFLAYLYDKLVAEKFSLVSIGMVSFVAIAQFTPAVIGGIYWKRGNKNAALTGIVVGFCIWFFTLIVPSLVDAGIITKPLTQQGLWGFSMLKPTALFGLEGVDSITHSFFWSIFLNTLCYVGISLFTERKSQELYQSELFVDIYKHYATAGEGTIMWKGTAYIPDLKTLLANFIGEKRSTYLLESYARKHQINLNSKEKAEPGLVNFAERVLAGTIGSASARIMVKTVVKEEELGID